MEGTKPSTNNLLKELIKGERIQKDGGKKWFTNIIKEAKLCCTKINNAFFERI